MRRYGKGWYGESRRHYLASKGIKTNRYFSHNEGKKQGFMDKLTVSSNAPDSEKEYREQHVQRTNAKVHERVHKLSEQGKLDTINMQSMWSELDRENTFYLQTGDEQQHRRAIEGILGHHTVVDNSHFSPFRDIEDRMKTKREGLL